MKLKLKTLLWIGYCFRFIIFLLAIVQFILMIYCDMVTFIYTYINLRCTFVFKLQILKKNKDPRCAKKKTFFFFYFIYNKKICTCTFCTVYLLNNIYTVYIEFFVSIKIYNIIGKNVKTIPINFFIYLYVCFRYIFETWCKG